MEKAAYSISKLSSSVQNSTRQDKKPGYLFDKINKKCWYKTRLAEDENAKNRISETRIFEKETAQKSFIPRTTKDWNNLPNNLRDITTLKIFNQIDGQTSAAVQDFYFSVSFHCNKSYVT